MIRHWVVPFLGPGMAATNSCQAHQHPLGSVFFNGFNHVIGTSRPKTAGRRKGRGNKALVKSNWRYQYFLNHFFLVLVTAKLCNWLTSFLLNRRASPGLRPVKSRCPN